MALKDLPTELHLQILQHLDWESQIHASDTCMLWRQILSEESFRQSRYMLARCNVLKSHVSVWKYPLEHGSVGIHRLLDPDYNFYVTVANRQVTGYYYERPGWEKTRGIKPKEHPDRYIDISNNSVLKDPLFANFYGTELNQWLFGFLELGVDSNIGLIRYDWRGTKFDRKDPPEEIGGTSATVADAISWIVMELTGTEGTHISSKPDFLARVGFCPYRQQTVEKVQYSTSLYLSPKAVQLEAILIKRLNLESRGQEARQ